MKPVVLVLVLALTLYALIDCARTPDARMKAAPKPLWLMGVVLIPVLGPVAWLVAGRVESPRSRTRRTVGPDDDPAFIRRLDDEQWRRRQQERRRRAEGGDEPPTPV